MVWFSKKDIKILMDKYQITKEFAEFVWKFTEHSIMTFELINSSKKYERTLEIGCGTGAFSLGLFFKFNKLLGEYHAIDYSKKAIEIAKKRFLSFRIGEKCKFKVANAENLPYNDDYFDLIIMPSVLEHIQNQNDVLKEINRVLKKNGIFLLSTDNKLGFLSTFTTVLIKMRIGGLLRKLHLLKGESIQVKSNYPIDLFNMLKKNNFKIKNFTFTHFTFPFMDLLIPRLKNISSTLQIKILKYLKKLETKSRMSSMGMFHNMQIFKATK